VNEYENARRVNYEGSDGETLSFVPVCPHCGRFVKADKTVRTGDGGLFPEPNATCSKCGRVEMPFEGFV